MVIRLEIGQSAGLLSKSVMVGYERVSTTERVLVDNDSLTNLNLLKIQSGLLGNFKDKPTDSNYIHFPGINDLEKLWQYSLEVAEKVSKLFPAPNKLEFEEAIYVRFLILTKKRYMYTTYKDGKMKEGVGKKGVLLARRDNSKFVRDIYEKVVMMVFNKEPELKIKGFIIEQLNKLCSGGFKHDDFVVTKSVGDSGNLIAQKFIDEKGVVKGLVGDYRVKLLPDDPEERLKEMKLKKVDNVKDYYSQALPAQVQLALRMRGRGKRVDPGSRIEYVITTNGGHTAKQSKKVEHIDYFKKFSNILKMDYLYYLKLLSNPLDQILNVIYDEKDFVINQYKLRQKIRQKVLNDIENINKPRITLV